MKNLKHFMLLVLGLVISLSLNGQSVFINEIHYDNAGIDQGETIEIFGPSETTLNGWQLVMYNGETGKPYANHLFGTNDVIPGQGEFSGNSYGVITVGASLQDGDQEGDGLALINNEGDVVEFLSYEGSFNATEGPAMGLTSIDIGVIENGSGSANSSLQRRTTGWDAPSQQSFGNLNINQLYNGGGSEGGDCFYWVGDCGITDGIMRKGSVHIGGENGMADPWAKLQVTGNTALIGELRGINNSNSFVVRAAEANAAGSEGSYMHLYGDDSANGGGISMVYRGDSSAFVVTHHDPNAESDAWQKNLRIEANGEMIARRSLQLNTGDATIPLRIKTAQWGDYLFAVENNGKVFGNALRVGSSFWNPEWDFFRVKDNGKVIIGNAVEASEGYLLAVAKGIQTQKMKVCASANSWCDYVFEEDYKRNSIEAVEAHIKDHKHLPNVPSAQDVEENGINVAEMDATLLRQIEELWLHLIDLKKENDALKREMKTFKETED